MDYKEICIELIKAIDNKRILKSLYILLSRIVKGEP